MRDKITFAVVMVVLSVVAVLLTVYSDKESNTNFDTTTISSNTTLITTDEPITVTTTEKIITTAKLETTEGKKVEATKVETTKTETTKTETTKVETTISAAQNGTYTIPGNGGRFKSYTNYRLLNKSSPQWNKIQCHENAYTDKNGLRKVGDYYCVAMGSYYSTTLGDTFEITTEGGTFRVVLCDFKANQHTDSTNRYTAHNGCVIEFYVDMDSLNSIARQMGDISYADSKFGGRIISINKIGNIFS